MSLSLKCNSEGQLWECCMPFRSSATSHFEEILWIFSLMRKTLKLEISLKNAHSSECKGLSQFSTKSKILPRKNHAWTWHSLSSHTLDLDQSKNYWLILLHGFSKLKWSEGYSLLTMKRGRTIWETNSQDEWDTGWPNVRASVFHYFVRTPFITWVSIFVTTTTAKIIMEI